MAGWRICTIPWYDPRHSAVDARHVAVMVIIEGAELHENVDGDKAMLRLLGLLE